MALLTDNLVSYYKLDGNSNDSVGSNNGTDTSVSYVAGKINNGASFNGSSSKLNTGNPIISSGTTMSFSCWAYSSNFSQGTDATILSNQTDLNNYGFIFGNRVSGNNWQVFYGNGSGSWQGYGSNLFSLTNNVWTHIVATINGNVLTIYKNGTQISQATYSNVNFANASNLYIGVNPSGTAGRFFNGLVDEVGIWSRALSSTEVNKLYNAGRGNQYPFVDDLTTSIVSYYKLDESSGNASDSVGSNTATNTSVSYTTGKINNGASFSNSSGSLLTISNSGQFSFKGNPFSIEMWINPTDWNTSKTHTLIDFESSGWVGWLLRHTGSNTFIGGNMDQQLSSALPTTGVWTHLIFTSNGTDGKMYFNGSLNYTVGTLTYPSNSSATYGIGCNAGDTTQSFNGTIDEIGIWSRALTSTEVTTLYNGGAGLQYPFSTFNIGASRRRLL